MPQEEERPINIPGKYGVHDVIHEYKPDPYPTCISEFDYRIIRFTNLVDDANGELMRIDDCKAAETKKIDDAKSNIEDLSNVIQQYNDEIATIRSQKEDDAQEKIAKLRSKIKDCNNSIKGEREDISEANKIIRDCDDLIPRWTNEKKRRETILKKLQGYRAAGVEPDDSAKLCNHPNVDKKTFCKNEQYFVEPHWGLCMTHRHP